MRHARTLFTLPVLAALLLGACGNDDGETGGAGDRTIEVDMVDIAFEPDRIQVRQGETVTFRFTNEGRARHEAVIGDESVQERHAEGMAQMDGMPGRGHGSMGTMPGGRGPDDMPGGMGPDDMPGGMGTMPGGRGDGPRRLELDPGETGELTVTFDEAGTTYIGCHEPGHWEAGMKVTVEVR